MRRLLRRPLPDFAFDRVFLRRLWTLLKVLFPDVKHTAVWLALFVLLINFVKEVLAYFVGILPADFYEVLGNKDLNSFPLLALKACLIIIARAFSISAGDYLCNVLYITWRQTLCTKLHGLYFKRFAFYKLNVLNVDDSRIDNPDQRMTQDVEKCTRILATQLLAAVIMAPLIICYYTYLTYKSTGYIGPVIIYLYFVLGTIVNKLLLSPVVRRVNEQERREGDFRYKHMSIRSNAEAVAFYHSGRIESDLTNFKLDALIGIQQRLVNWKFPLSFSTNTFDYFGAILSYMIMAIPIFVMHEYDNVSNENQALTKIISQNAFYYMYLISAFSKLIDLSSQLGEFAGTTHRVVELLEELEKENSDALRIESGSRPPSEVNSSCGGDGDGKSVKSERSDRPNECLIDIRHDEQRIDQLSQRSSPAPNGTPIPPDELDMPPPPYDQMSMDPPRGPLPPLPLGYAVDNPGAVSQRPPVDDRVAFTLDRVTYTMPDDPGCLLVADLSMQILRHQNLLITGDSSAGKTSVFRILAGLWHCTGGRLDTHWRRSSYSRMLFVPQRPYLPHCITLKQQVTYPRSNDDPKDSQRVERLLAQMRLESLLARCGGLDGCSADFDWAELTPGEAQRLAMCRVFYHRPAIAFLDESTSALGHDMELLIYQQLHKEHITVVSIGHRLSLKRFHDLELHLDGTGGWALKEIEQSLSSSRHDGE